MDSVDKKQFTSDTRMPVIKSPEQENGSMDYHNHLVSGSSKPMPTSWAPNLKLQEASDKNEEQVPSELISSCVATLLMIQVIWEFFSDVIATLPSLRTRTLLVSLFLYCNLVPITV